MTTREQALAGAVRLAHRAAQLNSGPESCPYPASSTRPITQAARRTWLREYRRRRPLPDGAVDFGDDLTALAHGPDDDQDQADTEGGA